MIESQATGDLSNLTSIVHQIRKRWRMKLALRGAAMLRTAGYVVLRYSVPGALADAPLNRKTTNTQPPDACHDNTGGR